jgi:hypothetical protein
LLIPEHPRESDRKHQLIRAAAVIFAFEKASRNAFDTAVLKTDANGVARADGDVSADTILNRRSPPRAPVGVAQRCR